MRKENHPKVRFSEEIKVKKIEAVGEMRPVDKIKDFNYPNL